jgi:Domain of unknown function (DUF397)
MNEERDLSRAVWFKSSFSNGQGGACVECATNLCGIIAVRDSKQPHGPKLLLTPADWHSFIASVKVGCHGLA